MDDISSSDDGKRKKRAKSKSHRKRKDRKRRRRDEEDSASDDDSREKEDEDSYHRSKRKKKDRKKEKRRRREERRQHEDHDRQLDRNYLLADALCELFDGHPALATELPIMLIRLAGGTTFDLSQMTDPGAAQGIARVFESLEPFGVTPDANTRAWRWNAPTGNSNSTSSSRNSDLVLLKLVRAMLDEIGITMEAVEQWENGDPPKSEVTSEIRSHANGDHVAYQGDQEHVTTLKNSELDDDDESDQESDDVEGPYLPGSGPQVKGPSLPPDMLRAQAEKRKKDLDTVKMGGTVSEADLSSGREEWMLVPGKYDFLEAIQAGKTIRSRQFGAQSKADRLAGLTEQPMDPATKAEIDAIKQLHEESRGPSLMEQHRTKKAQEAAMKGSGDQKAWAWNRDRDLDAGRRVDKDALNTVLDGAKTELKNRFHSA